MKNKNLIIVFIALLLIYLGVSFFGNKKEESFNDMLTDYQVEQIDNIRITPKDHSRKAFDLVKMGEAWVLRTEGKEFPANNTTVENVIRSLNRIKVDNIVAKKPEKWAKYELETDHAKKVELFENSKKIAALFIGKPKFNPQAKTISSYLRLAGNNQVFSTDGFNGFLISDDPASYRDKSIARFDPMEVKGLTLKAKGIETAFRKKDGRWTADGTAVDSSKMASYISSLSHLKGSKLTSVDFHAPDSAPSEELMVELPDKSIRIVAYPDTTNARAYIIHSAINEKAYFDSDSSGIYKIIFEDLRSTLSAEQ